MPIDAEVVIGEVSVSWIAIDGSNNVVTGIVTCVVIANGMICCHRLTRYLCMACLMEISRDQMICH